MSENIEDLKAQLAAAEAAAKAAEAEAARAKAEALRLQLEAAGTPAAGAPAAEAPAAAPASARPVRSPLTSHRRTEEPFADRPSARSWRVRVLPVPVAPATRMWRLNMGSGILALTPGTRAPPSMSVPIVTAGTSQE